MDDSTVIAVGEQYLAVRTPKIRPEVSICYLRNGRGNLAWNFPGPVQGEMIALDMDDEDTLSWYGVSSVIIQDGVAALCETSCRARTPLTAS